MKFFCLQRSMSCPVDLIGQPDCENCEKYGKCENCGKQNSSACKNCEAYFRIEEKPDIMCERLPGVKCILKTQGKDTNCWNCDVLKAWLEGLKSK